MIRKSRFLAIICSVIILITTAGCKESYHKAYIYFELPQQPTTLDPQTASTDTELLITKNIYEGLLRKNSSGAIACGAASDFSYENMTYTFNLRKDAIWSNGDPVTANDFVYALRRAVDPKTKSPFVSRLFSIQNAEAISNGKLSPETLGVSAPDDSTVVINMSNEDSEFENTLTTSIAMPCNEKFFTESTGKYGLENDYIISNGSYALIKWNKDPFGMRLYKNDKYTGSMEAKNSAVFLTCDDEESELEKLEKNSIDIAFIDSSLSDEATSNGLKTIDYQNICWFMTISSDFSQNLRKSLMMLIGNEVYGNDLKTGYTVADSIFPSAINSDSTSSGMTFYDLNTSKELYTSEINKLEDKKFPSPARLYYYDNGVIKPVVTDIVGHWQNNLNAFVNIEATDDSDKMTSQLTEQTYNMAVFPVRADNANVAEYLKKFNVQYNGQDLGAVQTEILKSSHIIPIAFQNTTIAYSSAINEIYTEFGNGYIDFSFIIKEE